MHCSGRPPVRFMFRKCYPAAPRILLAASLGSSTIRWFGNSETKSIDTARHIDGICSESFRQSSGDHVGFALQLYYRYLSLYYIYLYNIYVATMRSWLAIFSPIILLIYIYILLSKIRTSANSCLTRTRQCLQYEIIGWLYYDKCGSTRWTRYRRYINNKLHTALAETSGQPTMQYLWHGFSIPM